MRVHVDAVFTFIIGAGWPQLVAVRYGNHLIFMRYTKESSGRGEGLDQQFLFHFQKVIMALKRGATTPLYLKRRSRNLKQNNLGEGRSTPSPPCQLANDTSVW